MRTIPAADLGVEPSRTEGDAAVFTVGTLPDGKPQEMRVFVKDGVYSFFPERSSAQRAFLESLGL